MICCCGHVEDEHLPGGPCQVFVMIGDEPSDCACVHFEYDEDAENQEAE